LQLAKETLAKNNINVWDFAGAISQGLEKGRGKMRNVILIGEGNCGKTFLLRPLCSIYRAFSNPASGSFAWLGVQNAEVIFLNDFRWQPQTIAWGVFLTLLEGDAMHFSAPKTSYTEDIFFDRDTPIFATSSDHIQKGVNAGRENRMTRKRWTHFEFTLKFQRAI